jgi:hypothetical protein
VRCAATPAKQGVRVVAGSTAVEVALPGCR